jgi:hypothetical protein
MADDGRARDSGACKEEIQMTPAQSNACLEESLTLLVPIFECAERQITQFHADLKNGYFSFEKIWARVLARADGEG